jgi:broad specificity phosphatase PhoE
MERNPSSPEHKRFGQNVEIHAIFVRHGEKDESGNLTDKGKEQASDFGEKLESKDAIKAYSSPVRRAVETVEQVIENSPHDKKLKTRLKTKIGIPQSSQEFYKKFKELEKLGDNEAAEWFLSFGSQKPDAETSSPHEVAESFAYILTKYLRMTDKIYSRSNIDLIHGTHQGLPEALLKEVLKRKVDEKDIVGFEKLDDIGGALKFTEGMEFFIKTDEFGNKKINVNFRNQVYGIDMSKLDELAKSYAEKQNEK